MKTETKTYQVWEWQYKHTGGWIEASKTFARREAKHDYATGRIRSKTVTVTTESTDWEEEEVN